MSHQRHVRVAFRTCPRTFLLKVDEPWCVGWIIEECPHRGVPRVCVDRAPVNPDSGARGGSCRHLNLCGVCCAASVRKGVRRQSVGAGERGTKRVRKGMRSRRPRIEGRKMNFRIHMLRVRTCALRVALAAATPSSSTCSSSFHQHTNIYILMETHVPSCTEYSIKEREE